MNLRNRKGLTGADVAAAITVIVLTVGIVTAIYINTINKSKDNIRHANATRIATSIAENIQKKTYAAVLAEVGNTNTKTLNGKDASDSDRLFETKIPSGFEATVTLSNVPAGKADVARDVSIDVLYRTSTTHKTISINMVKERELIDMTNDPDFSLLENYKPVYDGVGTRYYYYPVTFNSTQIHITTKSDINWYNYGSNKCAFVYKTTNGNLNVDDESLAISTNKANLYAWVPRYVNRSGFQYLYGASKYPITFNTTGSYLGYVLGTSAVTFTDADAFQENDGLNGVWINVQKALNTRSGSGERYDTSSIEYKVLSDYSALTLP